MVYAAEAADIAPLIRHSQILALDSSDSESEPQFSGDEHSSSDDSGSAPTIIVPSSGDDTIGQSSPQSSSEQSSIALTPVVPSDKGIVISKTTRAEISSQYMKERKPLIDKKGRFIFAVHANR